MSKNTKYFEAYERGERSISYKIKQYRRSYTILLPYSSHEPISVPVVNIPSTRYINMSDYRPRTLF